VKGYTFVDYATQGYLVLVGVLIALFHGDTVPHWQLLIGAHLLVVGVIQALVWIDRLPGCPSLLAFLRHFYPVLLYAGLFAETGWLNQMVIKGYLDPAIIRLDEDLFGGQPSLVFMRRLPYLFVSEVFYGAYFSYYLMIGGVGIALYIRNRIAFFRYIAVMSFVFYICYLIYIFVPVIGPPIFFRNIFGYALPPELQQLASNSAYPEAIKSGIFFRIMKWIYEVFEAPGAAIPSSHVAIALCTVFFSFRYLRPVRWVHLTLAILLCLATIYCRYHYAMDVLAGIAAAVLLIPLGNWLYDRSTPEGGRNAKSSAPCAVSNRAGSGDAF
jgi:membrane-associated phospholipid phosphatase